MSLESEVGSSSTMISEKEMEEVEMAKKLGSYLDKKIEADNKENEFQKKLGDSWPLYPVIRSVPNMLREENEKAYTPCVVSIGPLHRENIHLQAMESGKVSYMCSLLRRTEDFEKTRKECETAMLKMRDILRKCYPDTVKPDVDENVRITAKPDVDENVRITARLVEMMVIDGCFIIELVNRHCKEEYDPILKDPFWLFAVRRDLLLLENQIPFRVLEKLFSLTVQRTSTSTSSPTLIGCLLPFFGNIMGLEDLIKKDGTPPPYHIPHLLHICYQPPPPPVPVTQPAEDADDFRKKDGTPPPDPPAVDTEQQQPVGYRGTATQLYRDGVKLRKLKKRGTNMFDVEFKPRDSYVCFWRGRLEIPGFSVDNFTESFLRNVIAFEQCCPFFGSCFTSHAFLMNILMDWVEDVELLEEAEVIRNQLGTRDSVLKIFNGICKNAPQHFYYDPLWTEMNDSRKPWRQELGTVERNCAGNLWIVLSIIGAFVLFVLTLLQTIYTMVSVHHPNP